MALKAPTSNFIPGPTGTPPGVVGSGSSFYRSNLFRNLSWNNNPGTPYAYQPPQMPNAPEPQRATVQGPDRGDYKAPDNRDVLGAARERNKFRSEYEDPTHSRAFSDLMGIASDTTARNAEETARLGQQRAARSGTFGGGGDVDMERASRDRMRALAEAGFEGAGSIRDQALKGYGDASQSFTALAGAQKEAEASANRAYADDLTKSRLTQAGLDRDFAGQLIDRYRAQSEATLGAGQLGETARGHDIESTIARNNFNLDAAKTGYANWNTELQARMEMQRLKEMQREFDLNRTDTLATQKLGQQNRNEDIARSNAAAGRDASGRSFGSANPFASRTFRGLV